MPTRVTGGHPESRSPVRSGVWRRLQGRGGKGLPPYGLGASVAMLRLDALQFAAGGRMARFIEAAQVL
jgi:hypothetical protein